MTMILGIDPGSRKTGFGVINTLGSKSEYVASGVIHVAELSFPERLKTIYQSLQVVIEAHCPEVMVVEQVFMAKNPNSALKLGQARGAAITAGAVANLQVEEYSARQIKQAVVGMGAASKVQVQQMVKHLLKLDGTPKEDAADALAGALCHAHTHQALIRSARSLKRTYVHNKGLR